MSENQGQQFTCPDCGKPKYGADGSTHLHIPISQEDREHYNTLFAHFDIQRQMDEAERTREINLNDKADLLDHLKSDNGHMMGAYAGYRATYDDGHLPTRILGVRNRDPDDDFELTHEELKNVHAQLHRTYDDTPHVTEGSYHRHL